MNLVNTDGLYYVKSKQVEQIYQDLSTELMFNMIERLAKRGNADLEANPWVWQLEKLNDMHMLTEESVKMIAEKANIAEETFRDVIENEGYRIYKDNHEQLAAALQSGALPDPQVQNALNALASQTMFEVDNLLNITLPNSIRKSFEQAVLTAVAGVTAGMKSPDKALSEAVQEAHRKGFYSFTDKLGRHRSVEPHLRTIIKTTTRRVAREMREKSAEDLGVDTFYYSIKSSARAYCAPLQHQIVSKGKGGTFDGIKVFALSDYGYGRPEGCCGINCGHYMTPFVLGVNYIPDLPEHLKGIDEKTAIKNAKAEARQRAFEREIRKSKELIEISKIVKDKELGQKHRLRLKTLRSGLKQHIEKHPFLYRDTTRERATKRMTAKRFSPTGQAFKNTFKDDIIKEKKTLKPISKAKYLEVKDKYTKKAKPELKSISQSKYQSAKNRYTEKRLSKYKEVTKEQYIKYDEKAFKLFGYESNGDGILTMEEVDVLKRYTAFEHKNFNEFLRGVRKDEVVRDMLYDESYLISDNVEKMKKVLSKNTLDDDLILHRGLSEMEFKSLQKETKFNNFISTSFSKEIAESFAIEASNETGISENYFVHIRAPKGTQGIYMNGKGSTGDENEFIVNVGQTYKVLDIKEKVLYLEITHEKARKVKK